MSRETAKRAKRVLKAMGKTSDIAGSEMILPNTSGDHVRSIKRAAPVDDKDLVNKEYVDSKEVESFPTSITSGSVIFSDGTNLTEDNFNLFWNNATNELQSHHIKIVSDGTQAAPALKFNDTNTGFFKVADSIRLSINNSTKMTVDATGVGIGTSPMEALDVNGGILARGPLAVAGVTGTYMSHEASDITSFFNYGPDASTRGGGYKFYIREGDGGNSISPLRILNNGNVGIGVT
ncbi:hypothetical protein LCGC14_1085320, partial [marine sediment metagenome]